jgi:5-formyltetrahydrofolate cyclo-ligase
VDPLDPKVVAELAVRAKEQLRRRARALRKAHSPETRAARSARLVERVVAHEAFQQARSVALFWPMLELGELDVRPLDSAARLGKKRVFYPFLARGPESLRTGFRLTESSAELAIDAERFAQPPPGSAEAGRGDIDLIVVPALAVAGDGHRLGYGRGFYDATLPDVRPPATALVVAYDFELMAELPSASHDVRCDIVLTDARTLDLR